MKANKRLIIIAVLFGIITVVALNYYLTTLEKPAMEEIPMTSVVVARSTIPAHTRITVEMLEVRTIPTVGVHPQTARSTNEVAGGISRVEIIAGEQILTQKVVTDDRRAVLSYRIPEGMRAVSIPIGDASAVAGFISPGDSIDILISFDNTRLDETEEEEPEDDRPQLQDGNTTFTYFQNVKVLATGSQTRERDTEDPVSISTLTLLVTPEEAEVLVYVHYETNLWLTLRSPLDDTIVELDSYNFGYFEAFRER